MNKSEKLEYQQQIEKYLEDHQVYDLFGYLVTALLKEKPLDPYQFLISKLETPERTRDGTDSASETDLCDGAAGVPKEGEGSDYRRRI